jgi:hypothetical protein
MTVVLRSGPLTHAQQEWLRWFPPDSTDGYEANVAVVLDDLEVPVAAATAAIGDLIGRHEGLRTLITREPDPTLNRQHVCAADPMPAGVVTLTSGTLEPAHDAAMGTGFRLSAQWPIRAVLLVDGVVRRIGLAVDHSAVDGWGVRVIREDLGRALAARRAGAVPFLEASTVEQPVDAALAEAGPAGLRYQQRAQRLWRAQLTELRDRLRGHEPLRVLGDTTPRDRSDRRYFSAWYASRPAAGAAEAIARRLRISVSSAYLAAFGSAIAGVEQAPCAGVFPFSANRPSAGAKASVRKAMMPTMPVIVPRSLASPDPAPFAACDAQALQGRLFGNADPHATDRMCEGILGPLHGTGVAYARFNFIDDRLIGAQANARSLSAEAIPYGEPEFQRRLGMSPPNLDGSAYYALVQHGSAGALISISWHQDTGWGEHVEAMMRHIEDTLLRAAAQIIGSTAG